MNETIVKIDFIVGVPDSDIKDVSTAERVVLCKEDGGYTIKYSLRYLMNDIPPIKSEDITRALLKLIDNKIGYTMLRFCVNGSWFYPPSHLNFLSGGFDVRFRDLIERFNIVRREFNTINIDKDNFDRLTNSICPNENYIPDVTRLINVKNPRYESSDSYLYQEKVDIDDGYDDGYDIDIPVGGIDDIPKSPRPFQGFYSDDDIDYDDDDEETEDEEDDDNSYGDYDDLYRDIFSDVPDEDDDDYEDDDEDDKKSKKKKRSKENKYKIKSSKVLKGCKHPKKNYDKYGILVADSKDDIRADITTIRKFLEEFIPGDSAWTDQFRRELSYRWALQFASTKKQLKKRDRGKKMEKAKRLAKTYADSVDLVARCVSNKTVYVLK